MGGNVGGPRPGVAEDGLGEHRTKSVKFIEQTPGRKLAAKMKEAEQRLVGMTGFRIKTVERVGTKLQQLLPNTNPWAGREDCITCKQGGVRKQDFHGRVVV
jgi:hypothetical protein